MELTDRNEILRQMKNSRTDCPYEGQQAGAWKVAHDCCSSIVESVAAIEAEPVRHGRWIECDYKCMEHGFIETYAKGGLCCSECRTGFKKSELRIKSYCPNCGAEMDLKLPEETEKGESPC